MYQLVSDIDEILRKGKNPIPRAVHQSFVNYGGKSIFITGAPLSHVPKELYSLAEATIFAEHGGVQWQAGKNNITLTAIAIEIIRQELGVVIQDGFQEIRGQGGVIIEGIREASLTFLFGAPPHYPFHATANREAIKAQVQTIIKNNNLKASILLGEDKIYSWLDCILTTKRETVQRLINSGILSKPFFYMGDKKNDLEVMQLDGAVPIAFPNCIPEIILLARQKGIYVPFLPYEEGIPRILNLIKSGKLQSFPFLFSKVKI